jgi:putative membrane protein
VLQILIPGFILSFNRIWSNIIGLKEQGMGILWIIILAVVIYLGFYYARKRGLLKPSDESPLDVLNKRYASGEISREEYEEMKRDLER